MSLQKHQLHSWEDVKVGPKEGKQKTGAKTNCNWAWDMTGIKCFPTALNQDRISVNSLDFFKNQMRHLHSPLTLSSQSSGHHVSQLLVPTATLLQFAAFYCVDSIFPSVTTSSSTPSLSPLSQTEENSQEKKRIVSQSLSQETTGR